MIEVAPDVIEVVQEPADRGLKLWICGHPPDDLVKDRATLGGVEPTCQDAAVSGCDARPQGRSRCRIERAGNGIDIELERRTHGSGMGSALSLSMSLALCLIARSPSQKISE